MEIDKTSDKAGKKKSGNKKLGEKKRGKRELGKETTKAIGRTHGKIISRTLDGKVEKRRKPRQRPWKRSREDCSPMRGSLSWSRW